MTISKKWIKNYTAIATTDRRKAILDIACAGLSAIDTEHVLQQAVSLTGPELHINNQTKDHVYDLSKFRSVRLIGFGKVVCEATAALEAILGDRLTSGIVIGTESTVCNRVESYTGSHPMPSKANVIASNEIVTLSNDLTAEDLVIVVVSGGGSSLLCWPENECEQGERLYKEFLNTGGTIEELNTVRKHISSIKGGGLAKMLYPATVAALIFSDVPGAGDRVFAEVASGPTYRDMTTVADAEAVLKKYNLTGYTLNETPKEEKYFEKVSNIPIVSNNTALDAMAERATSMGFKTVIISDELYQSPKEVVSLMFKTAEGAHKVAILAGGEPAIQVRAQHGVGGRNEHCSLEALKLLSKNSIFVSLASDGHDNNLAAGAIADSQTLEKATLAKLDIQAHLDTFDAYTFFEKTGDLIVTGSTEANVSDLMVLLIQP